MKFDRTIGPMELESLRAVLEEQAREVDATADLACRRTVARFPRQDRTG
jgi:hypothetical protein